MATIKTIDINADLGESFGSYTIGNDSELLSYISSANIACGFHAGDPVVIRATVRMALEKGVAIGAHPGYPDLQGFGRREMMFSPDELYSFILYQVGALKVITETEGGRLRHVKPHGALYNTAAANSELAEAFVSACYAINKELIIYGPPNSDLENEALRRGMSFSLEAFADRAYQRDGSLLGRKISGSLLTDSAQIVERVLKMVKENRIATFDGESLIIKPDTICIHGDNLHAIEIARAISKGLSENNIKISSSSN